MIQTVAQTSLPVSESVRIRKNRLCPTGGATADMPRLCVVTGTHGDELEGQFVCCELARRIRAHPQLLRGIVDLYPALNPLGLDTLTRGIPMFDLDMNRIFPGNDNGPMAEYLAARIMEDIRGADCCIDVHASNVFLREAPQVRINEESAERLMPFARQLNVDFIWVHANATVLESTLAYSLNAIDVPTLVVEMGIGLRLTREYCFQLVDGIFALLCEMGIWAGEAPAVRTPLESSDHSVSLIAASTPGIFVPRVPHGAHVETDQPLGDVLDPLSGTCSETVHAPTDGWLFTLREYPAVYAGSLLARILGGAQL